MREYLLTFLAAAVISYLMTPAVRRFAIWFGAMTEVRARDVHAIPTPRLGGLAMFFGMVGALVVAARLPRMSEIFTSSSSSGVGIGLLLAGGLITLIGIADDKWEIDALTKFAGQVAAAGLLIMNGVQLFWIPLPSGILILPPELGVPLTVIIIVATINAVNFIDGLDGLAAGTVGIAAVALFSYAYLLSDSVGVDLLTWPTLITAILAGMCVGFLPHNFNPARIFMGDTGSMLIGLMLSASTIMLTGQFDSSLVGSYKLFPVFVPLLLVPAVVAIPFMDMLLAVWRRTNQGKSPFAPDKLHLHHRLLELGHSHRRAVLIMYFWVGLLASCVIELALAKPIAEALHVTTALTLTVSVAATVLVGVTGVVGMVVIPRLRRPAPVSAAAAAERPREAVS
ncbi:MraY family glycosyltransferase [Actinomadura scrupuli]|uniref:MraY family glycosyltransferase n=1 Tax=Actinomadura scrupuli TaxID=559629 RepID=UPI003D97E659